MPWPHHRRRPAPEAFPKALFTIRRKQAYEALHPETKQSETRNGGLARQLGEPENRTARFTADTAAKTGQSERAVQRDAERGEKIGEDILGVEQLAVAILPAVARLRQRRMGNKIKRIIPFSTFRCHVANMLFTQPRKGRRKIEKQNGNVATRYKNHTYIYDSITQFLLPDSGNGWQRWQRTSLIRPTCRSADILTPRQDTC